MSCSPVLRVATIRSSEMEILEKEDGRIELSGMEGKFLNLILRALQLKLKVVIAEDGEWGRLLQNGSWTGMIGKIQQNKADIAINLIAIKYPRTSVVDFSTVYFTDVVTFAIEKQGFASNLTALTRAFDWATWTIMLVVLLLMPLIFRVLVQIKGNYLHILLRMLGAILKQPFECKHSSFTQKITVTTWLIYAAIISFSYSSVLLSILTIPLRIPTVQTFEELFDAVVTKDYEVFFEKGLLLSDVVLRHERESLRWLAESSIRNNWLISTHDFLCTPQINKHSAIVTDKILLQEMAGPEEWKWNFLSDDTVLSHKFAIAMKKGFCHKKRLNTLISRVNSAGLYMKILNDETFNFWLSHSEKRRTVDISARSFSFADLIGAFVLNLTFSGICFLVFIIEIVDIRIFLSCKKKERGY